VNSRKPSPVVWNEERTVAQNARERLPDLAREFLEVGRAAAAPGARLETMHPFRLQAKRLRYTLESFEDYYGAGLKRRIEALQALQDLLGAISDCAATQKMLRERKSLPAAERNRLLRILKPITTKRIEKFRAHWRRHYSQPSDERWWTGYLARFARVPSES